MVALLACHGYRFNGTRPGVLEGYRQRVYSCANISDVLLPDPHVCGYGVLAGDTVPTVLLWYNVPVRLRCMTSTCAHMSTLPRSYLPRMAAWNAARTTNSDSALRLCPDISK